MNLLRYYANLCIMPVYFLLVLGANLIKGTKVAFHWTMVECGNAYRSNRRAHKLED